MNATDAPGPATQAPGEPILRVAVPRPLAGLFDYLPPAGAGRGELLPGVRLSLPFGRGRAVGVLVELAEGSNLPDSRLRRAHAVIDRRPLLGGDLMRLARRAADYYHHPIGEVLAQLLPPGLRRGEALPAADQSRWFAVQPTPPGEDPDPRRAPVQARLLDFLRQREAGAEAAALAGCAAHWRAPLQALCAKGLVEERRVPAGGPLCGRGDQSPPRLSTEQAAAVAVVADCSGFQSFLLQGVTGSGKTEVYLRLIQAQADAGRQCLLLVPEIGLTPQLIERLSARLALPMAVFHSGLGDSERGRAWLQAARGEVSVVLGTRSAVFTPMARPGLILVDEEHDGSFKQHDGFRYHARDLAVLRASQLGVPVVLGSATPSLESLARVAAGDYRSLTLSRRAGGAQLPKVSLLDMRGRPLRAGIADRLLDRIRRHLEGGAQVLIFLNRRGYAPVLLCHACGWTADCRRCDAHMTLHRGRGRLRCHHCGAERSPEPACPQCGGAELLPVGKGTERLEVELAELFPQTPVLRVDRDTTRRRGALDRILADIRAGRPALLVGTQMLAKGHHFPDVTLVALLDADRGLYGVDFRATEQMAQLIVQVGGRAGRAERPGEVLIQTHQPDHPALLTLIREGYAAFAQQLLAERREVGFPPYGHLALLRAEGSDAEAPRRFLEAVARRLAALEPAPVQLLGPVAAPMERLAGRYRAQLLLHSPRRGPLHHTLGRLSEVVAELPQARRVRWSLDVDPMDML